MRRFRTFEVAGSAASVAAGLAFYAVFIARTAADVEGNQTFTLFDDAMISMRYADNLADGYGLVWNPSGPAVEGYTNFLWTLWMAFLHLLWGSGSPVALAVMVTGAVLLALTALSAGAVARRLSGMAAIGVLATLATALSFPLAFWTLRGMEVGLLAFLITVSVLLCLRIEERSSLRDLVLLCAAVVAMTLTRTDAALFGLVFAGWLALRPGFSRRAAGIVLGAVLATLAGHTALRNGLYGEALPNTYYLKLHGIPLGDRLGRGFQTLTDVAFESLWLPTALALAAILGRRGALRMLSLPAAIVVVAAGYSVWVGGDAWESMRYANRYVSVVLPALFALAACGVAAILAFTRQARMAFLALVAVCLMIALAGDQGAIEASIAIGAAVVIALLRRTPAMIATAVLVAAVGTADWGTLVGWARSNPPMLQSDVHWTRIGLLLARLTPPDATIAVTAAGSIPYYARRETVDILGKSDAHVAHSKPKGPFVPGHNKWDYDYSIGKLRPDVVVQLWEDSPAPVQLMRWGYDLSCLWVLRSGAADPKSIGEVCRIVRAADSGLVRRPSARGSPQPPRQPRPAPP